MSKIRLELNTRLCVNRFQSNYERAQKILDSEVLRCSARFVPMDTGELRRSGQRGTVLGSGKVIYDAPYAKKQYYGLHYNHTEGCAQWFEKAKAIHKQDWIDAANAALKGEL